MKYVYIFLLAAFSVGFFACNADYNPSFVGFANDGDRQIKKETDAAGIGSLHWKLVFPGGKVKPEKSYIRFANSASGQTIFSLPAIWPTADANGNITLEDSVGDLPAGTYFLNLYLANDISYVMESTIVTIENNKTTGYERGYTDNHFKPFARLTVNVKLESDPPVNLSLMKITFHGEADTEFTDPLPKPGNDAVGWQPDVREFVNPALGAVYTSSGWTAIPTPPATPGTINSRYFVKLEVADVNGRKFIKTRGPYDKTGLDITLALGTAQDTITSPLKLLYPVEVDPSVLYGSFEFGSIGTDGVYYGASSGYEGAEEGCEVLVFDKPSAGMGVTEVEVTSTPSLAAVNNFRSQHGDITDSAGAVYQFNNYYSFVMPRLDTGTALISGSFTTYPYAVKLETDNTATKLSFGFRSNIKSAVDDAASNQHRTITILTDITANTDSSGTFSNSGSDVSISIPTNKDILIVPDAGKNITITRDSSFTVAYFDVQGKLAFGAGSGTSLKFAGVSSSSITHNGNYLGFAGNVTIDENDPVFISSGKQITISGSMASGTRAAISVSPSGGYSDANHVVTLGSGVNAENLARFKVKHPYSEPWTIVESLDNAGMGYLYGPEVEFMQAGATAAEKKQFLKDIFTTSGLITSTDPNNRDSIKLLKDIRVATAVSDQTYITVNIPSKYVLLNSTPGITYSIKRAAAAPATTSNTGSLFDIQAGNLEIQSVTLDGGSLDSFGATVLGYSSTPLVKVTSSGAVLELRTRAWITNNHTYFNYGGGLYIKNGSVILEDGLITGNKSSWDGGGVYLENGSLKILQGGVIRDNVDYDVHVKKNTNFVVCGGGSATKIYLQTDATVGLEDTFTSGQQSMTLIPESYPSAQAVKVLSATGGSYIAPNKGYFSIEQDSAGKTWKIADSGYMYLNITIDCHIPTGTQTLSINTPTPAIVARGGLFYVDVSGLGISTSSDVVVYLDNTKLTLDSGNTTATNAAFTVAQSLTPGQYTAAVFLTKSGTTYSGNFQVLVY
ncbi:MAG: hypothetical protein LBC77_00105 [Spirochaetaceae bacterium]|jgi:hypothetical protein|nr:hypothetical protein [Spirochaetaceae bacterium]